MGFINFLPLKIVLLRRMCRWELAKKLMMLLFRNLCSGLPASNLSRCLPLQLTITLCYRFGKEPLFPCSFPIHQIYQRIPWRLVIWRMLVPRWRESGLWTLICFKTIRMMLLTGLRRFFSRIPMILKKLGSWKCYSTFLLKMNQWLRYKKMDKLGCIWKNQLWRK